MLQPCCTKQVRSARNGALSHRRRHFSRWYPIPSIPSPGLANRRKSSEQLSRAEFVEYACARCFDQAMSTTRLTPWPAFRPVSNCISPIQPNQTKGTPVVRPQFSHFPSPIDCAPVCASASTSSAMRVRPRHAPRPRSRRLVLKVWLSRVRVAKVLVTRRGN